MRSFADKNKTKLISVACNRCGKELAVENGILKEGCFRGDVSFGYFSRKDGMQHFFDLCEECYDKMTAEFTIPVRQEEIRELL